MIDVWEYTRVSSDQGGDAIAALSRPIAFAPTLIGILSYQGNVKFDCKGGNHWEAIRPLSWSLDLGLSTACMPLLRA